MDEEEQLSSLVGDIYDASLDPSLWPSVLKRSAQFVGALASEIVLNQDVRFEHGCDPHYTEIYEKYRHCDPRNGLYPLVEIGEVVSVSTALSTARVRESRFYQEWMRPQGVSDNFICIFGRVPSNGVGFGIFDDESHPPAAALRRTRLLIPHMRRAVLMGNAVDLGTAETATFTDALDGLRAGIFLIDANQRIVHANRSGHAMLAMEYLLRTVNGKLTANEVGGNRTLDTAVAMAAKGDGSSLVVPLQAGDGDRYVAHLLPLTSGARRRAAALYKAVAILIVHKAELQISSPLRSVAKHYKLTPAELSVMLAIVELGGVPEVANELGIAQTTVRTHLQRVFSKTDSHRQADLIKLLAELSSPFF